METIIEEAESKPAGENQDQPIHALAISCRSLFRDVVNSDSGKAKVSIRNRIPLLFQQRANQRPILTLSDLRDDFELFRVWANNLGVFASDSSCLDFRLKEAVEVRDGIASLLRSMATNLRECQHLLEKDRSFDSDEDLQQSSSDSDDNMNSEHHLPSSTKMAAYELQARLRNISEIVDKLVILAEAIRASGVRSRTMRAANYEHIEDGVNYTKLFENDYLPRVLKHRFKLEEPLLTRFSKAISLRRRRFLYQARHQKRLAYGGGAQEEPRKKASNIEHIPSTRAATMPTSHAPRNPTAGSSITQVPTKATTFKVEQKPGAPSTIISSSNKSVVGGVDFPTPPPLASDRAAHFECPYCCLLVPRAKCETKAWQRHVIADLQPFICIEPDCLNPDVLLESKTDWIEHQKWNHALEWWCEGDDATHAASRFRTEDAFIEHLQRSHGTKLSADGLRSRLTRAGHSSLTPFTCCPFCDFLPENFANLHLDQTEDAMLRAVTAQKNLQEHLARELTVIFLLALPDRDDLVNTGSEIETERLLGSRSTLSDISDDPGGPILSDESVPTFKSAHADPSFVEELWADVWASPQLKDSVRERYTGMVHDEVLKHIAESANSFDEFDAVRCPTTPRIVPGTYSPPNFTPLPSPALPFY